MKVLIDTSAWVDFINGYASPEHEAVRELLAGDDQLCTCGLIVTEVFQGLRKDAGISEFLALFREQVFLEPSGMEMYVRSAQIYRLLRERGITVRSTIDCLIVALAEETGCYILARDRDIERIVESGLVKARFWRQGPSTV